MEELQSSGLYPMPTYVSSGDDGVGVCIHDTYISLHDCRRHYSPSPLHFIPHLRNQLSYLLGYSIIVMRDSILALLQVCVSLSNLGPFLADLCPTQYLTVLTLQPSCPVLYNISSIFLLPYRLTFNPLLHTNRPSRISRLRLPVARAIIYMTPVIYTVHRRRNFPD